MHVITYCSTTLIEANPCLLNENPVCTLPLSALVGKLSCESHIFLAALVLILGIIIILVVVIVVVVIVIVLVSCQRMQLIDQNIL